MGRTRSSWLLLAQNGTIVFVVAGFELSVTIRNDLELVLFIIVVRFCGGSAEWANEHNKRIDFVYKGSVDIYRTLQQGQTIPYDAVWAANHLWIELGDTQKMVRHEQSIYRSPVVLGVRQSLAQQLGWDKQSVKIKDILAATDTQKLHLAMTSATQSNSGASAYLGFLYNYLSIKTGDDDFVRPRTGQSSFITSR